MPKGPVMSIREWVLALAGPAPGRRLRQAASCCLAVGLLGCSTLKEWAAESEPLIPENAEIEWMFGTDESWRSLAVNKQLGNPKSRRDVPQRWASPNYSAKDWAPVAAGEVNEGPIDEFGGAKWIWYPADGFEMGGTNAMPENARVVHFRRVFYNDRRRADIQKAQITVMSSGKVTFAVYVNGYLVTLANTPGLSGSGYGMMVSHHYDEIPDLTPSQLDIKRFLEYGRNVIAIAATTHVGNTVGGQAVYLRNYVRSGIMASVVID